MHTHLRRFFILSLAALLLACASTYKNEVVFKPSAKLERGRAVLVATPKNGFYNKEEYPSSRRQTAAVTQAAFARFSNQVAVSSSCTDLACLQTEGKQHYAYFVVPEILHWEDRATEWSGKPDRIEVKLVVFDGQSAMEIASIIISGKSKWGTFGGDHPQDLLSEPIKQYVESLY